MADELRQIHELLDGGLSPEEKAALLEKLASDPRLRSEFEGLAGVVGMMETAQRPPVPASFAADVVKGLPPRKRSSRGRLADFFLGERVLRWNVATVAVAALLLLALGAVLQNQGKETPVASRMQQAERPARTVSLSFHAPQAKAVSLAGDFNKWSVEEGTMRRQADGTWIIDLPLKPGVYHYMFVVDGDGWVPDPRAESYRDDGFGNKNAVLRVNDI